VTGSGPAQRAALRDALRAAHPWLLAGQWGPQSVSAGECDRCGQAPRLLPTCGPVAWQALCRDCAADLGTDAWCDGHREEGIAALVWAADLPDDWDDVVRLWWIATGEVRLPPQEMGQSRALRTVSPPSLE
jgi:hypothetical protein